LTKSYICVIIAASNSVVSDIQCSD